MSGSTTAPPATEKTYRDYKPEQGASYAQARRAYDNDLFRLIIDKHTSTGGELNTALDVGCGPGTATHGLSPYFDQVIGIDASEGMISTARSLESASNTSKPIRFEVSAAEALGSNLDPPIQNASIDLITAATAAHWFDMARFWPRAAQVLKPGGTVALWVRSAPYVHKSTPNHAAIQDAIRDMRLTKLTPYREQGTLIAYHLYADLLLPWTLEHPVSDFEQSSFFRKHWGRDEASGGPRDSVGSLYTAGLDQLEKMLGTSSEVTRWREAHPDAVDTERDVVRMVRREVERLLHEAGVEEGKEEITGGSETVLLNFKKKV